MRGITFAGTHYLRVKVKNGAKYYQYDHGLPFLVSRDDESYELERFNIKKRITNKKPIQIHKPTITVSFLDEDGDQFEMIAKNIPAFERILDQFPRLRKAFTIKKN